MVKISINNPPVPGITTDELVKVSAADTTAGYLGAKIAMSSHFLETTTNPGANEILTFTLDNFTGFDTDDLAEGITNLYFTNERVDDRVFALLTAGANIGLTYNDPGNTLEIKVVPAGSVSQLQYHGAGGVLAADAELFWDNTNNAFGVGEGAGTVGPNNKFKVKYTNTNQAGWALAQFDQFSESTINGDYVNEAVRGTLRMLVNSGVTDTGEALGMLFSALRNNSGAGLAAGRDGGTLDQLIGLLTQGGHYNADLTQSPHTDRVYSMYAVIYGATGTIDDAYYLYMPTHVTGGTITNLWGVYQEDPAAINYFRGLAGFGTNAPVSDVDIRATTGGILTLSLNDTSIIANQRIGKIQFWGNDTQLVTQNIFAEIEVISEATVTTDAAAGTLIIRTTRTSVGGSPVEVWRWNQAGAVGLAGANFGTSGQAMLSAGSSATPAWTTLLASHISDFSEAVDDRVAALLVAGTGIASLVYNDAGGTLTINTVWQLSAGIISPVTATNTLQVGDGTAANPSYAFGSDPNTGIGWTSADRFSAYAKAIEMTRWDATAGQIIINPANQGFDMYWHTANDSAGTIYVNGGGDSVWFGTGETPVVVGAPSKVNIQVGGIHANYGGLSITHIPVASTGSIIVPSIRTDFSFEQLSAAVKTLTRSNWEQTYGVTMNDAGGTLILGSVGKAMEQKTYSPTLVAGTLTDDLFRFVQYQRNINAGGIVEEADIHKSGAFRNRFSGVAAIALGAPPVPDSFVVAFGANYILPDAQIAPQVTGVRLAYIVQDKFKAIVGTGYIYMKCVIRAGTVLGTGFTGDIEYQAIDAITNASWAGSQWNNYTVMAGAGGIPAHYAGGAVMVVTGTPVVYWWVPRYY